MPLSFELILRINLKRLHSLTLIILVSDAKYFPLILLPIYIIYILRPSIKNEKLPAGSQNDQKYRRRRADFNRVAILRTVPGHYGSLALGNLSCGAPATPDGPLDGDPLALVASLDSLDSAGFLPQVAC
jgi:hypothetical protein